MLRQHQHIWGGIFRALDASVVALAWVLAYFLRFYLPVVQVTKGFPSFESYLSLAPLVALLWITLFSTHHLYASRRLLRGLDEMGALLRAHTVGLLLFISLTYMFSDYHYSRGVLLYFGLLAPVLLLTFRLALRLVLRQLRARGYNLRHALLVGSTPTLENLSAKLRQFPEFGVCLLGIVGDVPRLQDSGHKPTPIPGVPLLGSFAQLPECVRLHRPDMVLISLPSDQGKVLDALLGSLEHELVDIRLVPDLHAFLTLGCAVEEFEGIPIVHLNETPLAGWGSIAKRLFDWVGSGCLLLGLSPLLGMLALLIKLSSYGPILYRQERMGLDGRTFLMIKFRSMAVDAERSTGAIWAQAQDSRRTWLGALLRRTSLDELPQLWNVFRGEMSLVGPRPERPVFVEQFRGRIPHYMLRHKVKAGITGWAQINGWRGNTSLDRRIECDLYYIRHWSFGLDLKILLLTLFRGFYHRNAY